MGAMYIGAAFCSQSHYKFVTTTWAQPLAWSGKLHSFCRPRARGRAVILALYSERWTRTAPSRAALSRSAQGHNCVRGGACCFAQVSGMVPARAACRLAPIHAALSAGQSQKKRVVIVGMTQEVSA